MTELRKFVPAKGGEERLPVTRGELFPLFNPLVDAVVGQAAETARLRQELEAVKAKLESVKDLLALLGKQIKRQTHEAAGPKTDPLA